MLTMFLILGLAFILYGLNVTYVFPEAKTLREIEQVKLPSITLDDDIFDLFPVRETTDNVIEWEQMDNYIGLQQHRGLNGQPHKVNRVGAKSYRYEPGVYGEFITLDENELTRRRELGQFTGFVSIADMTGKGQTQLLNRRYDRIRKNLWDLLATGTFSVTNPEGQIVHTDVYALQTFSAGTGWSTIATASPFSDIRATILKARGMSVVFNRGARLYMNQKYVNYLMTNTNANDMFGKRLTAGSTVNSLQDINAILGANDLPEVRPYDRGYLDDTSTFQPFIPDGKAILVGKRTNDAPLGEYLMTRNVNNPDVSGGPYTRVIDRGENQIPRTIEVHDGHNGGPVVYYPGAVVVLSI